VPFAFAVCYSKQTDRNTARLVALTDFALGRNSIRVCMSMNAAVDTEQPSSSGRNWNNIYVKIPLLLLACKHKSRPKDSAGDVLDRILHTVKLCATQNLPLRGHRESLQQSENLGNFLAVLKLIAQYDTMAAQHLDYAVSNPRSVAYLSHDTQNEFIELMRNAVRQHIIEEIHQAKYFV